MKIKNGRPPNVQRETADLAHHFTSTGRVPIILGAPRNELGDDVPIQFIRHVPEKIPSGNTGLTGTPLVHYTVGIIVEDLLLEGVQGLIELESSMTRGERRHKDVGLGAFDSIVLDTGVDGFQNVVGTEAERTEIEGCIGNEAEQMGGVLNGDGGGFVDALPKLAPETIQHEFGSGFATRVFGNARNVQSDPLPFLVAKNVLAFLLEGLAPAGSPRGFLLEFKPSIDVLSEKTRLTLLGGKMPDFMDFDQGVPLFHRFDQFGRAPGPA